jgi:hypothetical protein
MKGEHLFVPGSSSLHFAVTLIADTVVNPAEGWHGEDLVEAFSHVMHGVARQERSGIVNALHKGVNRITVCSHGSHDDTSMFVSVLLGLSHTCGPTGYCILINSSGVVNSKSNITNTVTMLTQLLSKLLVIWVES